jgi:hypothetical protein
LTCSILVAALCLVAGTPVPENENRLISFAVTTETPTTSLEGLHREHENISSVCQSMIPTHNGTQAQNSVAPYKVNVSSTAVEPRGIVTGNECCEIAKSQSPTKGVISDIKIIACVRVNAHGVIFQFSFPVSLMSSSEVCMCKPAQSRTSRWDGSCHLPTST